MNRERVAVITIHGVGDHPPCEMARSVTGMLEDLEDMPLRPRYSAFTETKLLLNVAPVKVAGHALQDPRHGETATWGPMGDLYASQVGKSKLEIRDSVQAHTNSLDHLFMEGQLAHYRGQGAEETYATLRLEGKRYCQSQEDGSITPEQNIHVYDMYWSDLSGVNKTGLRIFGELYQLLFHLGSVGVNNVKAATIFFERRCQARQNARQNESSASPKTVPKEPDLAKKTSDAWRRFDRAQVCVAAILAWPIPLLNLMILAFGMGLLADKALVQIQSVKLQMSVVSLVPAFILLGAWGWYLKRRVSSNLAHFSLPLAAFFALCGAAALLVVGTPASFGTAWTEWIEFGGIAIGTLAGLAAVWGILILYEKRRPGTMRAFALVGLVIVLATLGAMFWSGFLPAGTKFKAMVVSLRLIEVTSWLLVLSWLLFWVAMAWAFLAGRLSVRATAASAPEELDRAQHTNWTARLTISLAAIAFLLLTSLAWEGLVTISLPVDPGLAGASNLPPGVRYYVPLFPAHVAKSINEWAHHALLQAGLSYLPVLLLVTVLAGVICVWGLFPSVWTELVRPDEQARHNTTQSKALWSWLTHGYQLMRWAGRLLYLGMLTFPLALVLNLTLLGSEKLLGVAVSWEEALGAIVGGGAIGVLAFGGRLSKLAPGFRPLVRVALDVDNWLREHPLDSNPTGKICARYVSLLRHICGWRDKDGRGYDRIIVFAHSQGTVISTDLLRFLYTEKCAHQDSYASYDRSLARLDKLPVYLFTVGCPLRQLYGLRFPYLYGYAHTEEHGDLLPAPEDLGLEQWVNAYRTGDYIGRDLWRPEPWVPVGFGTWGNDASDMPNNIWEKGRRVEFSLGPGAHTHYWDSTAEDVAATLDILISR